MILGLEDWLPSADAPPFFGDLDRDPHIKIGNIEIRPDRNISDWKTRSLRERLFSRPWRPMQKIRHKPIAYIVGTNILMSWASFNELKAKK